MMTVDKMAQAIREMGLDPEINEGRKSLSVAFEMTTVACLYDERRETVTMALINRPGLPEEKITQEAPLCHRLNEITSIAKCFIDAEGDQIMVYQSKLWHEEDISGILRDGLRCLAAMKAMYVRMSIDFSG